MKERKNQGYTISGILIEEYGYKQKELQPFPEDYHKVGAELKKLRDKGSVAMGKKGKHWYYYWVGD